MTYYADLTPYAYDEHDQPMINVGWLDRSQPFPTGSVDPETDERMVRLASFRRAVMRGWHDCQFCEEESPILLRTGTGDDVLYLGHSELRVEGDDGRVFAAPPSSATTSRPTPTCRRRGSSKRSVPEASGRPRSAEISPLCSSCSPPTPLRPSGASRDGDRRRERGHGVRGRDRGYPVEGHALRRAAASDVRRGRPVPARGTHARSRVGDRP